MSIAFKKYVNIISGVGGGAAVRTRDLIARLITSNKFVSPDSVLEFRSADDVATYFGTASEEYKRAAAYFAYVSPNISAPRLISFSRWSEAGNGAAVIGNNDAKVLLDLQAVTAGTFNISVNGAAPVVVGPVNLAAAANLAAVATALQTAVAAAFPGATVTYGTDGANRFTIQLAAASVGPIVANSVTTGAQDVGLKAGITVAADAYMIAGVAAQTALEALQAGEDVSDNFGSFLYLDDLSLDEVTAIALYNKGLNVKYQFHQRVTAANAVAWSAALLSTGGVGLTLMNKVAYPDEYPDQLPMAILAATNYDKRNAVTNFMFRQQAALTPLVTDTENSDDYDALRVNYYGQTATAGQKIAFYQRGKLMGLPTDPVDMNVYANEQWLKDRAGADLMALQLGISRIPANDSGRAMILGTLQSVIDAALFNGTISVGKTLNSQQKIFIEQQTGNENAWREVESIGYIVSCVIESDTQPDGSVEYKAVYTLIYSKDDAIRLIEGTHQLI